MPGTNRRSMLRVGLAFVALPGTTIMNLGCSNQGTASRTTKDSDGNHPDDKNSDKGNTMQIQFLEIVTPDVDGFCTLYSQMHGVVFGDAEQDLGGARTTSLPNGGKLGVRAPMRDSEKPVVRPYILVDDIKASVAAAANSGAEIAMPPTEIAGHGTFAIVIQGGIESGLWQL